MIIFVNFYKAFYGLTLYVVLNKGIVSSRATFVVKIKLYQVVFDDLPDLFSFTITGVHLKSAGICPTRVSMNLKCLDV